MFVDIKGPRPAVIFGAVLLAAGYFPLRQAYIAGTGSVPLLCLFSASTGLGGCAAFAAAVKTSALNWPHHRGTATAFPLAAFGLSAFFFSVFSQFVFPGDTANFLMLLAAGTFGLTFVSFFFLRVLPHSAYTVLSGDEGLTRKDSNQLRRTKSEDSKYAKSRGVGSAELGKSYFFSNFSNTGNILKDQDPEAQEPECIAEASESCSLMSRTSSSAPGDLLEEQSSVDKDDPHRTDVRGVQLFRYPEFWFQFSLMGILTGIGLMTIK
jgi:hypothetical protein